MIINPIMHGSAVQTRNTTYLYYNGNENTPLTGGWAQTNYDNNASYSANVQVVKQDKYIYKLQIYYTLKMKKNKMISLCYNLWNWYIKILVIF